MKARLVQFVCGTGAIALIVAIQFALDTGGGH